MDPLPGHPPLSMLKRCGDDPLRYSRVVSKNVRISTTKTNSETNLEKLKIAQNYGTVSVVLKLFERWLELGIRPSREIVDYIATAWIGPEIKSAVSQDDYSSRKALAKCMLLLWKKPVDDLVGLRELVNGTRRNLWQCAPGPAEDQHLVPGPSQLPGADFGLFAVQDIPMNTKCCFYSGDVHSAKSSQLPAMLSDGSYLLRIGRVDAQPWWYCALAHGTKTLQEEWDRLVGETAPSHRDECYVNPSNVNIKARYINDCLETKRYNVKYVLDPKMERAAVVSLRDIKAGEELFVSYGQYYWESLEAATGIVPRKLPFDK